MIGTFFTITGEDMTTMIGYIGDLFSDLSPIILLIVGVGVICMFLGFIIRAFSK